MNINDIIEKDGKPHIVVSVAHDRHGVHTETMELREWLAQGRIIQHRGEYMTVAELLDREMAACIPNHKVDPRNIVNSAAFYKDLLPNYEKSRG